MRQDPDLSFEMPLWSSGLLAAGLDEAGRGAWAGPVSAGAVILPSDPGILERLKGVRDSKQMTPRQRFSWAAKIKNTVLAWGIGYASNQEIDSIGILPATRGLPQTATIRGDSRCLSLAAASVLAKTGRDALMAELALAFPGYGLEQHKGYGTARHRQAMCDLGLSPLHRRSYAPCRALEEGGSRANTGSNDS